MKKLEAFKPDKNFIKRGKATMIFVKPEIAEAVKILGAGKMARGIRTILENYEEEILEAARKTKKAS